MTFSRVVGIIYLVALLSINFGNASPLGGTVRQGGDAVDPETGLPIIFVDLSDENRGGEQAGQQDVVSNGDVSSGASVVPQAPEVQVVGLNDNPSQEFSQGQESTDGAASAENVEESAQTSFSESSDGSTGTTSNGVDGDQTVQTSSTSSSDGSAETTPANASDGSDQPPQAAGNSPDIAETDFNDGNEASDDENGGTAGNEGSSGANQDISEGSGVDSDSSSERDVPVDNVNVEDSSANEGDQGSEDTSGSGDGSPVENVNVADAPTDVGAQESQDTSSSDNGSPVENVNVEDSPTNVGAQEGQDASSSGDGVPVESVNVEDSTSNAGAQDTSSSSTGSSSESDVPVESVNVEDSTSSETASGDAQEGQDTSNTGTGEDSAGEDVSEIDIDLDGNDVPPTSGDTGESETAGGLTPVSPPDASPVATSSPDSSDPESVQGSDGIDASPGPDDEIDEGLGADALAATPEPESDDSSTNGVSGRTGWIVGGSVLGGLALVGLCAFIALGAKKRNNGSAAPVDRENLDIVTDDARHGAYGASSRGMPPNGEGTHAPDSQLAGSNHAEIRDYTNMEHGSSAGLAAAGAGGAVEDTGAPGVARATGAVGATGDAVATGANGGSVAAGGAVAAGATGGVVAAGSAVAAYAPKHPDSDTSSTVATSVVENYGDSENFESSTGDMYMSEKMINSGTSVSHVQPIDVSGGALDTRSDNSTERSLPELDEDDDSRGI